MLKISEIILVVIALGVEVRASDHRYCDDLSPQLNVNVDLLMGVWYGVEYVSHTRDPLHNNRIEVTDSCFFIDIKEVGREATAPSYYSQTPPPYDYAQRAGGYIPPDQSYRHLILQWDERGNLLDYHVKFNLSRPGFWLSSELQNGASLPNMYKFFSGTIQVLRAVDSHLVLSFCQRLPEPQLFSVVLSRQPHQLDQGEIISIHNLLSMKRLSTSAVRKVCSAAHAVAAAAVLPTLALALLASLFSHDA